MWFENIWNTPLLWWLLLVVFGAGLIILVLIRRQKKVDPVKEHLDRICRCYARGELSRDDFEELKKDLQEYEKKIKSKKKRTPTHQLKTLEKR
ncbi:hypothetical protein SAMN05443144_12645 [Fodinibius roseus]|uniref:Short C-terminal domain-containing protein n=1 Tax=Fodinibius roseus TaxID=1194090 RepID=A0A1M5JC13_9BACT|nr:hypothetical protein [Fodinibius roseus]SHG38051.1 hypothetical protein SAMN05443144_12645 [Fodinibius roseus]